MNKILIIGNENYTNYESLLSVNNDINKIEQIFKTLNYIITKYMDLSFTQINKAVKEFSNTLSNDDNIIVYFSGHGFHFDGCNFILVKDSKKNFASTSKSEFYENFYSVFDIKHFIELSKINTNGNTMIIIDACRINEINSFKNFQEPTNSTNVAWQLYSTSLGTSSYANNVFTNAIESVIFRKNQTITELFSSICIFMENNCPAKEVQVPILISGKNKFCIVETYNSTIEKKYFQELLNIYIQVHNILNNYSYPYTKDKIVNICNEINVFIYISNNKLEQHVKEIINLKSDKMGFLELLIDQNIKSINVFKDRFSIHGQCSNYVFNNPYENTLLYDFYACLKFAEENSESNDKFKTTYGNVTLLNNSKWINEDNFNIIIDNTLHSLSYYIDEFYTGNVASINQLHQSVKEIFDSRKSFIISGRAKIEKGPFISALLNQHAVRNQKICELIHLTPITYNSSPVSRFYFDKVITDNTKYIEIANSIKNNNYEWIIIPLTAYHNFQFSKHEFEILLLLENLVKNEKTSFIFYTDYMNDNMSFYPITKQALPFIEYQINLESFLDHEQQHVHITEIKKISN